jgi:hypothetical protein
MVNPRQLVRALVLALLLSVLSAASVSVAFGQDFSLTVSPLHPSSVDPGGTSTAIIDLQPIDGFDSPVTLSCVVTSNQITTVLPVCTPSPLSDTPPADGPSLTITTTGSSGTTETGTLAGLYSVTVTGVSGALTHSVTLALNVVEITEDYTLAVSPTPATPNPVAAGGTATTTVTATPIGSYSGHQVTLSCLSVSPVVTASPYCSFNPATVSVTGGTPPTSVMTITTLGPTPSTKLWNRRIFYAFWLAVPGLVLVGVGATGRGRKNALGALLLIAVAGGLLLLPACNTANNTNNSSGFTTPVNTYTFTLTAADENGVAPGNNTLQSDEATVTLAVTAN